MKFLISFALLVFLFSCGNSSDSKKKSSSKDVEISNAKSAPSKEVVSANSEEPDSSPKNTPIKEASSSNPAKANSSSEHDTPVASNPETKTDIAPNKKGEIKKEAKSIPKDEPKVAPAQRVNHDDWEALLKKYVNNGNVAYSKFKNDKVKLESYLEYLAQNSPSSSWSKNEKLAYYINLYNAATVKLILDNYPIKSIKDINDPWGKKWVKVGDQLLSLGGIENDILRKMNEPRIHFAIVCASYSCPKLENFAFTASKMGSQLQQVTKGFINDTKRNQFTSESAKISEIFNWYKVDFIANGTVLDYISKYTDQTINTSAEINYLNYDWSLNESK